MYTFSPWSLWCFLVSTSQVLSWSLVLFLSMVCCSTLPQSPFQTSHSFFHLLGVLAAEGSQLSPSLGIEIQKEAALLKVTSPPLAWKSGGRACIQWRTGAEHTKSWPLASTWDYSKGSFQCQRCLQGQLRPLLQLQSISASPSVQSSCFPHFLQVLGAEPENTTQSWFPREPDLKINIQNSNLSTTLTYLLKTSKYLLLTII